MHTEGNEEDGCDRPSAHGAESFGQKEVSLLAGKLRVLAEDVGLRDWEVEMLVGMRTGIWPLSREASLTWRPSEVQERRLRMLIEVCASSITVFGPDARMWLRQYRPIAGASPVCLLLSDPDALPALRDAFRDAPESTD